MLLNLGFTPYEIEAYQYLTDNKMEKLKEIKYMKSLVQRRGLLHVDLILVLSLRTQVFYWQTLQCTSGSLEFYRCGLRRGLT